MIFFKSRSSAFCLQLHRSLANYHACIIYIAALLTSQPKLKPVKTFLIEFELDINGFINLLKTLTDIFTDNNLDFPISELNEFLNQ
jgi:hypothetical protein